MKTVKWNLWSILVLGTVLLTACAGSKLTIQPVSKTENPSALIQKLQTQINAARNDQVDQLSPTWFARAEASLDEARTGFEQGTKLSDILDQMALSRAQLEQARSYADLSRYHLAEVLESRAAAQKVGAEILSNDFSKAEKHFARLVKSVEQEDFRYVQDNKDAVRAQYRQLELRSISNIALADVRKRIQLARDRDMDELAPKSFALAVEKLDEAETFIRENRYDKDGIQARSAQARFFMERMQQVAHASAQIAEMPPEDIVLWMESNLHQIGSRLKQTDHRNLPFDAQQEHIASAINSLEKEKIEANRRNGEKETQIETLQQRMAELEGRTYQVAADKQRLAAEKERLAAEKQFNELFNQVQGYFSADEAEVYKQRNELIVRLKSMRFPVGQASVLPENHDLLAKVQKAILAFGEPYVVIEGHTDSTGSPTKNDQLSQARAEAVRQYLKASGTVPLDKLTAVGYGSSRPLAPNETAEGRAVNRRIDLIIKPRPAP